MPEACTDIKAPGWRAAFERLEGAYAENTVRAYRTDFQQFAVWCDAAGLAYSPAAPETVAQFIAADATRSAASTLKRRLSAIRKVHQLLEQPSPLDAECVRLAYRRALRRKARRPKQAAGLTAGLRDQLMAAARPGLLGLRDQAMIAVGYDTLCRRAELVCLQVEDLRRLPDGSGRILVRRAKNDPFGDGRWGHLSSRAMIAISAWLEAAQIRAGALFRPLRQGQAMDEPLHPIVVNRMLKRAAVKAGLPDDLVRRLSGHSLRVGAAQDLVGAGCDLMQIMTAGGWSSVQVLAGYAREAPFNIWAQVENFGARLENEADACAITE